MLKPSYYGDGTTHSRASAILESAFFKRLCGSLVLSTAVVFALVWLVKYCLAPRTAGTTSHEGLPRRADTRSKPTAHRQKQQCMNPITRVREPPDSPSSVSDTQPHAPSHPVYERGRHNSSQHSAVPDSSAVKYALTDKSGHIPPRTPRSDKRPVEPPGTPQQIHGTSSEHLEATVPPIPAPEPLRTPSRYNLRSRAIPIHTEGSIYDSDDFGDGPGMEETLVEPDEGSEYDPSASSLLSLSTTITSEATVRLTDTIRWAFSSRLVEFVGELQEFQQEDADKIIDHESEVNEALNQDHGDLLQRGHILMYDMGLGKTVVSIYLICRSAVESRRRGIPTLVVCPNLSLLLQWEHMFKQFSRNIKLLVYHDDIPGFTKTGAESLKYYDVVLATYSQLNKQRSAMNKADGVASAAGLDSSLLLAEWYRVILDESHEVRKWNPKAVGKQVQAVMALQKVHGLCLSGTPMQNAPSDLYPQLRFLGLSYEELMRRDKFLSPSRWESYELQALGSNRVERFLDILTKTCIRREYVTLSGNNLVRMPPKNEQQVPIPLTSLERSLYNHVEEIFVDEEPFVRIMRQRQACVMPHLLSALIAEECEEDTANSITVDQDEDFDVSLSVTSSMHPAHYRNAANISLQKLPPELQDLLSAQYVPSKIIRALDIIRQHRFASTGSDKMLVFSWFKGTVRLMSESLRAEGIDHVTFNGDTKDKSRSLSRIRTDPNCSVILMSIQAGGVGLDLTCCNVVLFLERWWNPYVEDQAVARVWRIGQQKAVRIYKLIACATIEDIRILETQARKKEGVEAVLRYLRK